VDGGALGVSETTGRCGSSGAGAGVGSTPLDGVLGGGGYRGGGNDGNGNVCTGTCGALGLGLGSVGSPREGGLYVSPGGACPASGKFAPVDDDDPFGFPSEFVPGFVLPPAGRFAPFVGDPCGFPSEVVPESLLPPGSFVPPESFVPPGLLIPPGGEYPPVAGVSAGVDGCVAFG
jgi:hypothetical protein